MYIKDIEEARRKVINGDLTALQQLGLDDARYPAAKPLNISSTRLQFNYDAVLNTAVAARELQLGFLEKMCQTTMGCLQVFTKAQNITLKHSVDAPDVAEIMLALIDEEKRKLWKEGGEAKESNPSEEEEEQSENEEVVERSQEEKNIKPKKSKAVVEVKEEQSQTAESKEDSQEEKKVKTKKSKKVEEEQSETAEIEVESKEGKQVKPKKRKTVVEVQEEQSETEESEVESQEGKEVKSRRMTTH